MSDPDETGAEDMRDLANAMAPGGNYPTGSPDGYPWFPDGRPDDDRANEHLAEPIKIY